ncbi:hypothetical protein [Halorubrum sp. 2020YC2]|uniref:hypothetical protein n=1 Tax=Halorubrum sp. 2020YC2 TaxID=2836432 RepID=UPI001BE5A151|nr:hypothetical protein [Halorubrum sp. 2020YC2]QWC19186.1 hypothetical protein KI388_13935 [Halorubrum sp. 2020YC2]
MNEEQVTEAVEEYLEREGWTMFAVDYPTSGSGLRLHPNDREAGTKHSGSIVPDIVAHRDGTVLIVECKPHFDRHDARKLDEVAEGRYSDSLERRVYSTDVREVATALAFPKSDESSVEPELLSQIDSLLLVGDDSLVFEKEA